MGDRYVLGFAMAQRLEHCAIAVSTAVLGQSHKDNVRCTAVEEQPEAKEVQLSQPSSTSLLMISSVVTDERRTRFESLTITQTFLVNVYGCLVMHELMGGRRIRLATSDHHSNVSRKCVAYVPRDTSTDGQRTRFESPIIIQTFLVCTWLVS